MKSDKIFPARNPPVSNCTKAEAAELTGNEVGTYEDSWEIKDKEIL